MNKKLIFSIILLAILVVGIFIWISGRGYPKCTDSDGGKDKYTYGEVKEWNREVSNKDKCLHEYYDEEYHGKKWDIVEECEGEGCVVLEFFCINDERRATEHIPCPNGCKNGACIE